MDTVVIITARVNILKTMVMIIHTGVDKKTDEEGAILGTNLTERITNEA